MADKTQGGKTKLSTADRILESASRGEAVTTQDRRHAVMYLMATEPQVTNSEMAEMFKVTERTIRFDKKKIREERSKRIKEEDVSLVIADILMDFERNVSDIEKSKKHATPGTRTYLEHCTSVIRMRLDTSRALQDLGYLPKSLGHLAVHKYNYQSTVLKDGSVETRKVESFEDATPEELKTIERLALPEAIDIEPEVELGKSFDVTEPDYLHENE